jgi:hypothetical protein
MKKIQLYSCVALVIALFIVTTTTTAQKLESEFLYKITLTLDPGIEFGKTPVGTRVVYPVTGGTFEGPKIKGKVRPIGADWLVRLDSTNTKLDVRLILETEDGELIYSTYNGFVRTNPDGTTYWRTSPLFETSSKKYHWLNTTIAVGVGSFSPEGKVTYEVFAIK